MTRCVSRQSFSFLVEEPRREERGALAHAMARNGLEDYRCVVRLRWLRLVMTGIPSFSASDVELLADSVRKTLEHLRDANERLGGNDPQIIEAGQRYSILLEKLQAISGYSSFSDLH